MRRKPRKGGARKRATARKIKRRAARTKRRVKRVSRRVKRKVRRAGRKVKRAVRRAKVKRALGAAGAAAAKRPTPVHKPPAAEENGPVNGDMVVEEYEEDEFEEEPFGEEEEEFHPETSEDY